ncbi:SDR family NAD(P)-dependent oxidoreductase [Pantoea coffeiphila]|uniref:Short-chain dehydrogenase n=1 Tax=Pantoea coffeiphila TaxID=1465635 RepID=A0A2S9I791_9GAMM|nr:SDR family oxidoreductase [Pantoea coffeiphila]PRD13636.1 short-chain dehydrogenase [Pantoea coffeiphila]
MKRFEGKVALVTGGRSGIGKAVAQRLRDEGARVFTVQRNEDNEFENIIVDFTRPQDVSTVVDKIIQKAGRLDILVNSAGMMQEMLVEDMSLEDWTTHITVNLTAPFLLIKTSIKYLRATGGTIVNIGSIEGIGSNPKHAAYSSSKAGLHGLTRAIAVDYSAAGVRCNTVAPGWIDTDLNIDFIEKMPDPDKFRRGLGSIHPVGRTGKPEEIASLVAWLASEESSFVTGQVWVVDGGRTIKLSQPE